MDDKKKAYCDLIISGQVPIESVLIVWPQLTRKTARNKSSALNKDPEVMAYIKDTRGHVQDKIEEKFNAELDQIVSKRVGAVLTSLRKRQLLDEIAEGRKTFEKVIVIDGKIKRVKCKPTPYERLKAIELDNRMSGDIVQAKPNQVAKAQEIEKIIIVEDETQPGSGNNDED